MQIKHRVSLRPYNTFGIDAIANTMVIYRSADELVHLIRSDLHTLPKPVFHLGEGSNILFMQDFPGTILFSQISDISIVSLNEHNVVVRVGAGWKMDDFIAYAIQNGWYGLENLSNIPGQVGASAVQNIGAYGVEVGDYIYSVRCVSLEDGNIRTFMHDECDFSYRHSIFKETDYKGKYAVVSVDYQLNLAFEAHIDYGGIRQCLAASGLTPGQITAQHMRDTIIQIRRSKLPDPEIQGNAGSFFMNPIVDRSIYERLSRVYPDMPKFELGNGDIKIPAAWMIEQCGWKGRVCGRAGVHSHQPLVLVNVGNATGADIKELSDMIRHDVYQKFGVNICPEVNFV